jgi:hypothetical protein
LQSISASIEGSLPENTKLASSLAQQSQYEQEAKNTDN